MSRDPPKELEEVATDHILGEKSVASGAAGIVHLASVTPIEIDGGCHGRPCGPDCPAQGLVYGGPSSPLAASA